jgi:type I restriction enzyme S subunit
MSGLAYKKDALAIKADKMIRVLRGGNIGEEQFLFKGDDVFISSELVKPELYLRKNYMITPAVSSLDHIGKIALIDKDYSDTVVGGFVLMLIPHFNDDVVSEYLLYAFAAKHHRDNCRNITHKSGQAFYNLSREQMMNLPVPIPPREEMGRIIAMLKRVLPKVADYAVVDTALQNLNGSFPEALKKSILQEAVQGKLVPQDPSDEPAEALLERIREEKQRLIKEGKIKKDKHESVIFRRDNSHYEKRGSEDVCIDEEVPFEIPENWAWARLSSFGVFSSGKTPSMSNPQFWNGNVPWVTSKDMKRPVITDSEMHISELAASTMQLYPAGTLLLVARSGILKRLLPLCKLGIDSTINQDIKAFSLYDIELSEWLFYGIKAFEPYILKELVKSVTTVESLKFDEFAAMMIPVPPLSEQRRIIAAIKAAMKLLTPMSSNPLFSL